MKDKNALNVAFWREDDFEILHGQLFWLPQVPFVREGFFKQYIAGQEFRPSNLMNFCIKKLMICFYTLPHLNSAVLPLQDNLSNAKKSLIDVPTCHRFFVHLGIVFHFIFIVVDANVWEENKSKIENNDNGIEVKSSPI